VIVITDISIRQSYSLNKRLCKERSHLFLMMRLPQFTKK